MTFWQEGTDHQKEALSESQLAAKIKYLEWKSRKMTDLHGLTMYSTSFSRIFRADRDPIVNLKAIDDLFGAFRIALGFYRSRKR